MEKMWSVLAAFPAPGPIPDFPCGFSAPMAGDSSAHPVLSPSFSPALMLGAAPQPRTQGPRSAVIARSHPACAGPRGVRRGAEPLAQVQCLLQAPGSSVSTGGSRPAAKCLLKPGVTPGLLLQGAGIGSQALGSTSVPQAGRRRAAAMASPCFSAPPSSATP